MTDQAVSKYVYVTYIRTTPESLWQALTDPEFIRQYWFGMQQESGWTPGSPWRMLFEDGRVADAGEVVPHATPYARWLQTVAVGGVTGDRLEQLAEALAAAGACRIAGFGEAPWPPAQWHHDGRGPLAELLRWTDLEPPER